MADLDGLFDQDAVAFVRVDVLDELALDFELGGGDAADAAEHGVAGAEVVDGELDVLHAQAGEGVEGVGELLDEAALGDLEDEVVCGDVVLLQEGEDDVGEFYVAEGEG